TNSTSSESCVRRLGAPAPQAFFLSPLPKKPVIPRSEEFALRPRVCAVRGDPGDPSDLSAFSPSFPQPPKGPHMTLQPDISAGFESITNHDFKNECDEKAKARARIVAMIDATAAEIEKGDPDTLEPALRTQAELLNVIFREYVRIAARTTDIKTIET